MPENISQRVVQTARCLTVLIESICFLSSTFSPVHWCYVWNLLVLLPAWFSPRMAGQDSFSRQEVFLLYFTSGEVRSHAAAGEQCWRLAGSIDVSRSHHMQLCGDRSPRIAVLFSYKSIELQHHSTALFTRLRLEYYFIMAENNKYSGALNIFSLFIKPKYHNFVCFFIMMQQRGLVIEAACTGRSWRWMSSVWQMGLESEREGDGEA